MDQLSGAVDHLPALLLAPVAALQNLSDGLQGQFQALINELLLLIDQVLFLVDQVLMRYDAHQRADDLVVLVRFHLCFLSSGLVTPFFIRAILPTPPWCLARGPARAVSIPSSSGQYFQLTTRQLEYVSDYRFQSLLHQGNTSNAWTK